MKINSTFMGRFLLKAVPIAAMLFSSVVAKAQLTYCTPSYTFGCGSGDDIKDVTLVGNTLTLSNLNTPCATSAYSDYTTSTTLAIPDLMPLVAYNGTVTTNYTSPSEYVKIWIDYNNDGVFDPATEQAAAFGPISDTSTGAYTLTVPATATPGIRRMRVTLVWNSSPTNPCGSYGYGETHDYKVNILALPACTNPPAPGTIASVDSICASAAFSITNTGASIGSGLVYQWQSAPAATGPWTDIAGANGLSYANTTGITTATHYRFKVVCNSGTPVYSNVKSITIKAITNCYCVPTYSDGCGSGDDIKDVTLVGNTQTLSNLNTPCPTSGYTNYTTSTTLAIPDLMPLVTYNGTVTTSYTSPEEYVKIWIDYNNDGVFDPATEQAAAFGAISNTSTGAYSIVVPVTATAGIRRMRVTLTWNSSPTSPCGSYSYGETHDYLVNILALPPCTNPPAPGTIASVDSICPNIAFTITNAGASIGTGLVYQWQSAPAATGPWTDIAGATGLTYSNTTGITVATHYRLKLVCNSGTPVYSNVKSITIKAPTECYCIPTYYSGCGSGDDIKDVTLVGLTQTLSNLNTPCPTSGYANYTTSTTLAIPDLMPTLTFNGTVTTNYTSVYEYVKIWIDFNNDGVFDPTSEQVANFGPISNTSTGAYSITIPSTATAGIRRMRVMLVYGAAPTSPCGSYDYGETHDYKVNILTLTPCTNPPAAPTIATVDSICPNIAFNITSTGASIGSGLVYQWQSAPAATGPWTNITGANSLNYNNTAGITTNTSYRLQSTCNTGTPVLSNVKTVLVNGPTNCYCIPPAPTYNTLYWIENVTTTGGTTNISNLATGMSSGGFGNYTSQVVSTAQNDSFAFNVQSQNGASPGLKIWIDWDHSGTFDAGEQVYSSTSGSSSSLNTYTGTIVVPATAVSGNTRMRIRNYTGQQPCNQLTYGETEDYTVYIGVGCTTPNVNLGPDKTICNGASATLDAGAFTGATYTWSTGASTQTISVNTPGVYWVSVSTGTNCVGTDTIQVGTSPMPTGNGINIANSSPSFDFYVAGAQNTNTYTWNFGDNSPTENGSNVSHTYTTNGVYTVSVVLSNDCGSITLTEEVTVTGASINKLQLDADVLKLYPNPANNSVNLVNESNFKMKHVTVSNILGQTLLSIPVKNSQQQSIDVSSLVSGIYNVHIEFENGTVIRKLEVIK